MLRILAAVSGFPRTFLGLLVGVYELLLLARVLMSWVNPRFDSPIARFLYDVTEPVLAPIRRALPATGMIDWSPLVAFVVLSLVAAALGLQ